MGELIKPFALSEKFFIKLFQRGSIVANYWQVDQGLPEDCRILGCEWDDHHKKLRLVLASESFVDDENQVEIVAKPIKNDGCD